MAMAHYLDRDRKPDKKNPPGMVWLFFHPSNRSHKPKQGGAHLLAGWRSVVKRSTFQFYNPPTSGSTFHCFPDLPDRPSLIPYTESTRVASKSPRQSTTSLRLRLVVCG